MSLRVLRSGQARHDLLHHFGYIARDNVDAANRFLDAYERGTLTIGENPEIGSSRILRSKKIRLVRIWPLPSFDKYLLVYSVRERTILILRVLHASQDYTRL